MNKKLESRSLRKIHVNLSEKVHQKLRVKCALEDRTIQEYVAQLIEAEVVSIRVGDSASKDKKTGGLT